MALIGINQVTPQNTRRPGVLDRVFQGLDTASKILSVGVAEQQAQTAAKMAGFTQNVQAIQAGGIPVPPQQAQPISGASPSVPNTNWNQTQAVPNVPNNTQTAEGPGAMTPQGNPTDAGMNPGTNVADGIPASGLSDQVHPMQASISQAGHDQVQNILAAGAVPASPELAAQTPNQYQLTSSSGQNFVFPLNNRMPSDESKAAWAYIEKGGGHAVLAGQPYDEIVPVPYVDRMTGQPATSGPSLQYVPVAYGAEAKQKAADASDKAAKSFLDQDTVKPFLNFNNGAVQIAAIGNAPPSRASDLALISQFAKAQNDGGNLRFNPDGLMEATKDVTPVTQQLMERYNNLWGAKNQMLHTNVRNDLINTIQTQYAPMRAQYDAAYQNYVQQATKDGLAVRLQPLPMINFGASNGNNILPRTNNPSANPNPSPAPKQDPRLKSLQYLNSLPGGP